MEKRQSPESEPHMILLDVSLFALDLLDPVRISEDASAAFSLEVPGAFVTMIRAAKAGSPTLRNFLSAYLLKIQRDELHIESPDERIRALVGATEEKLRAIAASAADRIIHEYAYLIEGAVRQSPDEVTVDVSPICRYETVMPVTQKALEKLRKAYFKELGLPPHPLYDLYFLQAYHAQSVGLAASPPTPRQIIALCRSTFNAIQDYTLFTYRKLRSPASRAEIQRRTKRAQDTLDQFVHKYLKPEWVGAAASLAANMMISFRLSGDLEPVMALVNLAAELSIVRAWTDHDLGVLQRIGFMLLAGILIVVVAPFVYRLKQPLSSQSQAAGCPPCPTTTVAPSSIQVAEETPSTPQPTATAASVDQASDAERTALRDGTDFCLYVVQPGDTLQDIGARFQVSQDDLLADNELLRKGIFRIHQMLIVSAPCCRPNGGQGVTHVIQRKETLHSIARRYNTTVERIVWANHIYDPSYIQEGQMLCVP